MGLIDLKTNLKSLKFGHDRIDAGSSGQPYIQSPIPDKVGEYGFLNTDFILRGGDKAVVDSVKDVERLGKYFTDVRNPSGLLFVAKQNLLSRTAVRTQASGFLLNEGAYTPLSTLIEAGGVAFGLHVNKQGLNPFGGFGGITTYSDLVNPNLGLLTSIKDVKINRLVNLLNDKITINTNSSNVLSYGGGPGSILGIGRTNIRFADQRTGVNNANYGNNFKYQAYGYLNSNEIENNINSLTTTGVSQIYPDVNNFIGLISSPSSLIGIGSNLYYGIVGLGQTNSRIGGYLWDYSEVSSNNTPFSQAPKGSVTGIDTGDNATYTKKDLLDLKLDDTYTYNLKVQDFRNLLRGRIENPNISGQGGNTATNILSSAPDYTTKNIEKRVGLGDPGSRIRKNLKSYTSGSGVGSIVGKYGGNASYQSFDEITVRSIYQSENPKFDPDNNTNDLVKFAITVIDNDNQSDNTHIHFRAFLNSISDQYSSDWNPTKYIGRGENFYTYGGFDRKVSLSWTVAAQSKAELIPMYKKLNYLASVCTPDYSANGYMRGNLVKLTIGGYFYQQPGIITGLSYEMNDDNATWEIGINDSGGSDHTVKELPHLIKVSSFNFIPIHTFVPRKQHLIYKPSGDILTDDNNYGPERYIALDTGDASKNNYGKSTPWKTNPVSKPVQINNQSSGISSPTVNQPLPTITAAPTYQTTPTPATTTTNNKSITAGGTNSVPYNWLAPAPKTPK